FLQRITAVSEEVAEQDACRMEHVISEEVFQGIKAFMKAEEELISTEEAQMLEAVRLRFRFHSW
ncbi:MAG: hypothetical protein LUF30_08835, partial [Lachnospiraceae bacterium]|nr:hypothetical protein [Lachnospiraceae bacterium]